MQTADTGAGHIRPRGRPRSAVTDESIHDAALQVVSEVGYRSATLDTIAARAGVGTATIYRRYRTKRDLLVGALQVEAERFVAPHTGDVAEDLAVLLHQLAVGVHSRPVDRVLAAMAFADPELFELVWASLAQPRRSVLREVIADAVSAGQLRADIDVEIFLDIISAVPIWTHLMRPGNDFSLETARATAALLLAGAGA